MRPKGGIDCPDAPAPTVTVWVVAYNSEQTIERAVASVLAQDVDFPIEIFIFDDASDDATVDRATQLLDAADTDWRLLQMERNRHSLGYSPVPLLLAQSRGRFIARLDGDDWWSSPFKLQRQVALLESHPRVNLCSTAFTLEESDQHSGARVEPSLQIRSLAPIVPWTQLVRGNFVCHSSALIRTKALRSIPLTESWEALNVRDYPLWALLGQSGGIGLVTETSVAYRVHAGNSWFKKPLHERVSDEIRALVWISESIEGAAHRQPWLDAIPRAAGEAIDQSRQAAEALRAELEEANAELETARQYNDSLAERCASLEEEVTTMRKARHAVALQLEAVTSTRGYRLLEQSRRIIGR